MTVILSAKFSDQLDSIYCALKGRLRPLRKNLNMLKIFNEVLIDHTELLKV